MLRRKPICLSATPLTTSAAIPLKNLYFTQIRAAGNSRLQIRNTETGEIYVADELGPVSPAYFFPNQGVWLNQRWGVDVAWDGTDRGGKPLPDGTPVEISLITAPEYYRNEDRNL